MLLELALPLHVFAVTLAAGPPVAVAAGHQAAPPARANPAPPAPVQARPAPTPAPVPAARLAAARGGTDQVNNNMNLNGSVANNRAVNVVTGSNTIDAGSFANMAGIPMVVQNTGANVLIQNATIVNLQMH